MSIVWSVAVCICFFKVSSKSSKTSFSDFQIVSSVEIPHCNSSSRILNFDYVNFVVVVVVCVEPCLAWLCLPNVWPIHCQVRLLLGHFGRVVQFPLLSNERREKGGGRWTWIFFFFRVFSRFSLTESTETESRENRRYSYLKWSILFSYGL